MSKQDQPTEIKVSKIWGGKFLNLYQIVTEFASGRKTGPYEMVSRRSQRTDDALVIEGNSNSDAVVIIATTSDKKLVVIREYRPAIGKWVWALPAGCLEKGQTEAGATILEMHQETGMVVRESDIRRVYRKTLSSVGLTDEVIALVFCMASGVPNNNNLEGDEMIETHLMGLSELRKIRESNDFICTRLAMMIELYCQMDELRSEAAMIV